MEVAVASPLAQQVIEQAEQAFGFAPNLIKAMAEHNPAVAKIYLDANAPLEDGVLNEREQQAVILTVSAYNNCHYCQAAHTAVGKMVGLSEHDVEAIKAGDVPQDERLGALVRATRRVLDVRGWLDEEDLADLNAQGIDPSQLYEIVAIVGIKTISNYINHIAGTEIDEQFR